MTAWDPFEKLAVGIGDLLFLMKKEDPKKAFSYAKFSSHGYHNSPYHFNI